MLRQILHQVEDEENLVAVVAVAAVNLAQPALDEEEDEHQEDGEPIRNPNYFELVIPNYNVDDFIQHFRMRRETFQVLLNHIQGGRINVDIIPFEKKLLFSIWVLAKQETFKSVGDRFNFAKSTAHKIFIEIMVILADLRGQFIEWPNEVERHRISQTLRDRTGFPGIIGAIDGTHVNIKAPPNNAVDYYNRNNCHSVILQAICNDKLEFVDVFAGMAGRVHDARVFRLSPIFQRLTGDNAALYIDDNQHILGDNAYPLMSFLMKPFRDNGHLREEQSRFNTRLSSVRSVIEQAFGLLKGKWRRLKYLEMARTDLIPTIIVAACVLHNFIIRNQGVEAEELFEPENEANYMEDDGFEQERGTIGKRKRNYIVSILH